MVLYSKIIYENFPKTIHEERKGEMFMIWDTLSNAVRYKGISRAMNAALDWLAQTELDKLKNGRVDIAAGVYANVADVDRKPPEDGAWEKHKLHADIQISLLGEEQIGVLPVSEVSAWGDYDGLHDSTVSAAPGMGVSVSIKPGLFVVLFPWDAHKPGIGSGHGRKVVIKVDI